MDAPNPPPRRPFYVWEDEGLPRDASARQLVQLLCGYLSIAERWRTPAGVARVTLLDESDASALIAISGAYEARVELSITGDHWVCAEIFIGDNLVQRAWIERAYEECEAWPDGADGIIGEAVSDDPPGRISKRGAWMQIDTLQWPGLEAPERWLSFEAVEEDD